MILLHLSLLPARIACLCIPVCHCDQREPSPIPADDWCHESGALLLKNLDSVMSDELLETAQELLLSELSSRHANNFAQLFLWSVYTAFFNSFEINFIQKVV